MAAPTRTGTPSQVDGSAGNGSTSVTVPADCTFIVAFWSHFDNNGNTTLSGLTLNSASFTISAQLAEGATTDEAGVGVAVLASPSTGSQTFAWTWSAGGARVEGGWIVLVYVKGQAAASPVRDAQVNATIAGADLAVTVNSSATDLVLAACQSFTPVNPALSGTVIINNAAVNSEIYDVSDVSPGASTTTVTMTNEEYSTMAAISIKEDTGATTTRGTPFGHRGTAFAGGRTFHGILQRVWTWLRPRNLLALVTMPISDRG